MTLTLEEIRLIFDLIRDKYGPGYADAYPEVMRLQAKLSIMGEAARRVALPKETP